MKLIEALEWRYAVKKMNGNKIPADKLNTIIEATRLAPSGFGLTPYTIIVVEDDEIRKKFGRDAINPFSALARPDRRKLGESPWGPNGNDAK